jgi:hypothetical protein
MAGMKSNACNAELLVLNHISPRLELYLSDIVREAHEASQKQSSVLVSFDFLEVVVPWMGFKQRQDDTSSSSNDDDDHDDTSGGDGDDQVPRPMNGGGFSEESDVKKWVRGIFQTHFTMK